MGWLCKEGLGRRWCEWRSGKEVDEVELEFENGMIRGGMRWTNEYDNRSFGVRAERSAASKRRCPWNGVAVLVSSL